MPVLRNILYFIANKEYLYQGITFISKYSQPNLVHARTHKGAQTRARVSVKINLKC